MSHTPNDPHHKSNSPLKVLFIAWGFSIHAKRRIEIFVKDPEFQVTVVSTHNYDFLGAKNILLSKALEKTEDSGKLQDDRTKNNSKSNQDSKKELPIDSKITKIINYCIYPFKFVKEIIYLIKDYRIMKAATETINPDIIFLQTLLYPCYLAYLLPRSIPMIITFWNGDVLWWAKWTGIERLLKKQIVVYGVGRAKAITVNSQSAYNACLDYGKEPEAVHIIRYPGIDLSTFRPQSQKEARKKIRIQEKKIIFWPRGTADYLHLDTLIRASPQIIASHEDTLIIVLFPNGSIDPGIKKMILERGLEKHYLLMNSIPHQEMPAYYASSDVMVSLSSNDSLPNTMLEAMACGCPVIMGDIPQIHEWVTDSRNGFIVSLTDPAILADRILAIFDNQNGVVEKFRSENLSLIENEFDSKKMSHKIKNLIRTTVTNRGV
jgi:glycosyltransferase involved in cell wall biosynthesis